MIFTKGGEILRNKKGISPLIATVLLIGFTIVLAALVMRWGGTLFKTTTQTTGCESQGRLQCTSTQFIVTNGAVTYGANSDSIVSLIVNNEGTVNVDKVLVQRELFDGTKASNTVVTTTSPTALTGGASVTLSSGMDYGSTVRSCGNPPAAANDLKNIYLIPIINYKPVDGSTPCDVTCSEQQITIPRSSTSVTCSTSL